MATPKQLSNGAPLALIFADALTRGCSTNAVPRSQGGGNTTLIDARRQSIALLGKLSEAELRALAAGATPHESVTDNRTLSGAPSPVAG
jgi:hypothetical protein